MGTNGIFTCIDPTKINHSWIGTYTNRPMIGYCCGKFDSLTALRTDSNDGEFDWTCAFTDLSLFKGKGQKTHMQRFLTHGAQLFLSASISWKMVANDDDDDDDDDDGHLGTHTQSI